MIVYILDLRDCIGRVGVVFKRIDDTANLIVEQKEVTNMGELMDNPVLFFTRNKFNNMSKNSWNEGS